MKQPSTQKKVPWYKEFFCCNAKNKNSSQIVSKKPQPPTTKIYSYDDLCQSDPNQIQLNTQLFYNRRAYMYCDQSSRLLTRNHLNDLRFTNELPGDQPSRSLVQYSCPICFRYFNLILKSTCCNNYVCHLCCLEYLSNFKSSVCHFCQTDGNHYVDVEDDEPVKIYSDSQARWSGKENQPPTRQVSKNY